MKQLGIWIHLRFGIALLAAIGLRPCQATDYHVSPSGSDAAPGTAAEPWQTLSKVSATSFTAGDRILLEGGRTFAGPLALGADDSGTAAIPIVVTSYGTGRATIDGGAGDGINVYNTAGISIQDLDLGGAWDADSQSGNTGTGIVFYIDLPGATRLDGVRIERVDVHGFKNAGVQIAAWASDASMSGFRDVAIDDVVAHDNGDAGINAYGYWDPASTDYSHRNITVTRSVAHHNRGILDTGGNSGNGIVLSGVDGARIERCLAHANGDLCNNPGGGPIGIWVWDAKNAVIRHNESHHNRTGLGSGDGGGFDLDGGTSYSLMEHNYSHDNDGAGYLVYQFWGARPLLGFNTVRYNVSENDGRGNTSYGIAIGGGIEVHDNEIHNNTVFISPPARGAFLVVSDGVGAANHVRNNVFMTSGGLPVLDSSAAYPTTDLLFQGNAWFAGSGTPLGLVWGTTAYNDLAGWRTTGQEKNGAADVGLELDPLLAQPGGGGTVGDPDALETLAAYRLLPGSPLIDGGLDLLGLFGVDPGATDFWGTALSQGAGLDVGAHESGGCLRPDLLGNTLMVVRSATGVVYHWIDRPDATSYRVYTGVSPGGPFGSLVGETASGVPGLPASLPAEPLVFSRVAAVNACGEGPR